MSGPPAHIPGTFGLPRAAVVRRVRTATAMTRVLELDLSFRAEPGQFAMVWLPGLDEKPFSLLADDPVAFAIAAVGPFSRAMHSLREGDRAWCRGPFGSGFRPRGTRHLLVGGGYGAAPLLFLARRIRGGGGAVDAVLGARRAEELLLADEFASCGARVTIATEDGSAGVRGRVTDVVAPRLDADPPDTLYACGPHGMLEALLGLSRRSRVPTQLAWEAFMRCGIGLCGSCEHEGRLLCTDGPVLAYDNDRPDAL